MNDFVSSVSMPGKKPEVRVLIMQLLAHTHAISLKEMFSQIKTDYGANHVSYQAIHKVANKLETEGVLVRKGTDFTLSRAYIDWLRSFAFDVYETHSDRPSISSSIPSGTKMEISANLLSRLAQLVVSRNFRIKNNWWFLFDNRVNIVPTLILADAAKTCREANKTRIVYDAAKKAGVKWIRTITEKGIISHDPSALTIHGGEMFAFAGWSSVYVEKFDVSAKAVTLVLEDSAEAETYLESYMTSKFPVCDFSRGLWAGGESVAFREPTLEFVETKCRATGDQNGIIEGKPLKSFNLKDKEIRRQLGL